MMLSNELQYLWAVTAVVWLFTLVYLFILLRNQQRLQKELDALSRSIQKWSVTAELPLSHAANAHTTSEPLNS